MIETDRLENLLLSKTNIKRDDEETNFKKDGSEITKTGIREFINLLFSQSQRITGTRPSLITTFDEKVQEGQIDMYNFALIM